MIKEHLKTIVESQVSMIAREASMGPLEKESRDNLKIILDILKLSLVPTEKVDSDGEDLTAEQQLAMEALSAGHTDPETES
jgi:hypothetical protein